MNLEEIIENARKAQEQYLKVNENPLELLEEIREYLNGNIDLLDKTYEIDCGKKLYLTKLLKQLEIDYEVKSEPFINELGKGANMEVPYGVLGVISDSDVYKILRVIVLGIITSNALIINITKNVGTNFLIIKAVSEILTKYNVDNFIQIYNNKAGNVLEENEIIDGIIYIGKKVDADRLKVASTKPVIYSGCGNYEIYIEDVLDENVLKEIVSNVNIRVYSKVGIGLGQEVSGLEEAIVKIQEYGSLYSAGIITESLENSQEFISKVKARNVFVNASPFLIDDELDIEPKDLMYKKSILVYK